MYDNGFHIYASINPYTESKLAIYNSYAEKFHIPWLRHFVPFSHAYIHIVITIIKWTIFNLFLFLVDLRQIDIIIHRKYIILDILYECYMHIMPFAQDHIKIF